MGLSGSKQNFANLLHVLCMACMLQVTQSQECVSSYALVYSLFCDPSVELSVRSAGCFSIALYCVLCCVVAPGGMSGILGVIGVFGVLSAFWLVKC